MAGLFTRLLGFVIKDPAAEARAQLQSFAPPPQDDGALTVQWAGSAYGTTWDMEASARTEAELVTRYRQVAAYPEVTEAITQIVNDVVVDDDEQEVVALDFSDLEDELADPIKKRLEEELDGVLDLLRFKTHPYEVFRQWYVDGRLYYHAIIDKDHPDEGILELRNIDPRKIRRVREVRVLKRDGNELYQVVNEYFLYNDKGFGNRPGQAPSTTTVTGVKIAKDSIIHATSGLTDDSGTTVLGWLHPAIKYINQLRALEDAVIIYRLVRAPERRVWEIDVGNLPKAKAEALIRDVMTRHKNRVVYDAGTGNVRDDRRYMSLIDDFYLARRPDGSGNKVEVLPGGELTGRMDDVEYFLKRVYKSLGVPIGRLMPEDLYTVGRSSEITREELSFSRQVVRLRRRFAETLLGEALGRQLVLKRVMSPEDWRQLKLKIRFKWARDNFSAELMEREIMLGRADLVDRLMPYVGRFVSNEYIRRDVLKQDDDLIEELDEQMDKELDDPRYPPPGAEGPEMPGDMLPPGGDMGGGADLAAPEDMPRAPAAPKTEQKTPKKG